jgi:hypothetical protein
VERRLLFLITTQGYVMDRKIEFASFFAALNSKCTKNGLSLGKMSDASGSTEQEHEDHEQYKS